MFTQLPLSQRSTQPEGSQEVRATELSQAQAGSLRAQRFPWALKPNISKAKILQIQDQGEGRAIDNTDLQSREILAWPLPRSRSWVSY